MRTNHILPCIYEQSAHLYNTGGGGAHIDNISDRPGSNFSAAAGGTNLKIKKKL